MMQHYTAEIEVALDTNPSDEDIDSAMDALSDYAPSIATTPRGNLGARITFPSEGIAQATRTAINAVAASIGEVVRVEVMTEQEADQREGEATVPPLVGVREAAELLGVSVQRVRQMIQEGKVAAHRIGDRSYALARAEVLAKAG